MEHYCSHCKETRVFRLKQESTEHNIYECSYCRTEWRTITGTGIAIAGAKFAVRAFSLIIGFPPLDFLS